MRGQPKYGVNFKMYVFATCHMAQSLFIRVEWDCIRWNRKMEEGEQGVGDFVFAFTGDSTSSTRWAKTETQLVTFLFLLVVASFIMLIIFACQHSWGWETVEIDSVIEIDIQLPRMDHCYFGIFMVSLHTPTPTHTHTHIADIVQAKYLATVFKLNYIQQKFFSLPYIVVSGILKMCVSTS